MAMMHHHGGNSTEKNVNSYSYVRRNNNHITPTQFSTVCDGAFLLLLHARLKQSATSRHFSTISNTDFPKKRLKPFSFSRSFLS